MKSILRRAWLVLALVAVVIGQPPQAQPAEKRIAFVVGDAAYQAAALQTPANDAGLIAQTLQTVGFEVIGARDLDQAAFVNAWNDFLAKAQAAGPDAIAFVYLGGYGLQFDGENFFASVDSQIATSADIATNAIRLLDISSSLASVPLRARILVLDAARANPFALGDPSIAGGLALVDPDDGTLVAFNAAPGTIAPEGQEPYGAYAQALAEMIGQGGLPLDEVFIRTRLRVGDATKGAFMPWNASKVGVGFMFRDGVPDATASQARAVMARPVAELGPQDAYAVTERLDTLEGYQNFLKVYPDDPLAARVRAMLAVRREAIIWRRTYLADTPNAFWTYLNRYPHGPHAGDARRQLEILAAALEPPPAFEVYAYDVPLPEPAELVYIERPVFLFGEPAFGFMEPPPMPVYFVPVINPLFVRLPPPQPSGLAMVLPVPRVLPVMVNNQPYRPVRQVALPMVTALNRVSPSRPGLTLLSNPATLPVNLKATKPLGPAGPKLLVNPTIQPNNLNPKPQPLVNTAIRPNNLNQLNQANTNKLQQLNNLNQSNQGTQIKQHHGKPQQFNVNQKPVVNSVNQQPVVNSTVQPNKLHAAKPLNANNPAGQIRTNLNATQTKPLTTTKQNTPQNYRVVTPSAASTKLQVVNPPKPVTPAVQRQTVAAPVAPRKPTPPAPCGKPGLPPCKH